MRRDLFIVAMLVGCSGKGSGLGSDKTHTADADTDVDADADVDADTDSDVETEPIDFSDNLLASPMPPGDLQPQNAPQIIVFGWDDCMFTGDHPDDLSQSNDNGMAFIEAAFASRTNPDGSAVHTSFYENGAYLPNNEVGGPWGSETQYTLAAGQSLLALGFELGNHTFDHLEINGTWGQIHPDWDEGTLGGWTDGAGTLMDYAAWSSPVIGFNDTFLKQAYGLQQLYGFRAPRLEINDHGLNAIKDAGYLYDLNMEEGHQWEYVTAAVRPGADSRGFNWVVWPHTLDNGSPGAWQSQDFGEKDYLVDYPRGLWESPVYMLYVPDNGLQQTIANRMRTEITMEDTSWIGTHVREITAFDFNTFLYARLTRGEWVEVMKYNFLLRYNGNRAPLTFGAHPAEFSARYDTAVLQQPGNEDFLDVLNYNTYQDRKDAVIEFLDWVQTHYGDDTWILSNKELIEYMDAPFDKDGNAVSPDTLATPTCNAPFDLLPAWTVDADALGSDATIDVVDGNSVDITFTVGTNNVDAGDYAWVDVATYFQAGALAGVSHIDVIYEAEAPFRLRLLPDSGPSMQVLLAGGPGERKARVRVKDFRPDPYADASNIDSAEPVDDAFMADVVGLAIENASTRDNVTYDVQIKRMVIHGLGEVATEAQSPVPPVHLTGEVDRVPQARGSAIFGPSPE